MYIYDDGSNIVFPYTITELKRDNPNISFPRNLNTDVLAEHHVFPVTINLAEYNPTTHKVIQGDPILTESGYVINETVVPLSEQELYDLIPKSISKLQGKLAIAQVGLEQEFLDWKNALDPVTDFVSIAFLEDAQTWEYDDPILNAALVELGLESQKPQLFTLAKSL